MSSAVSAAALAATLLANHRATVVATGREAIRHPAERVVAVAPLDAEHVDGMPSGCSSATPRRIDPAFAPDAIDRRHIRDLCRRLDGLPLAVELAASRTSTFSVSEIDALLTRRFELLRANGGGRHDALERTIEWSYDLLDPAAREVLVAVAGFEGPFDIELAAAAAGLDALDAADMIASLVDRSLIAPGPSGTRSFRLLESIRDFVLARRSSEIAIVTADRLGVYVIDLARRAADGVNGPGQLSWFDRCDRVLPAIRIAVERLLESDPAAVLAVLTATNQYWLARGNRHDALRWISAALERVGPADAGLLARACTDAATLDFFAGATRSRAWCERSLAESARGAQPPRPSALVRLASLELAAGDVNAAVGFVERALLHIHSDHQPPELPEVAAAVGSMLAYTGRPERGIAVCRAAIAPPGTEFDDGDLRPDEPGTGTPDRRPGRVGNHVPRRLPPIDGSGSPVLRSDDRFAAGMGMCAARCDDEAVAVLAEVLPITERLGMQTETAAAVRAIGAVLARRGADEGGLLLAAVDDAITRPAMAARSISSPPSRWPLTRSSTGRPSTRSDHACDPTHLLDRGGRRDGDRRHLVVQQGRRADQHRLENVTDSPYSHVAMVVRTEPTRPPMIWQAAPQRSRPRPGPRQPAPPRRPTR